MAENLHLFLYPGSEILIMLKNKFTFYICYYWLLSYWLYNWLLFFPLLNGETGAVHKIQKTLGFDRIVELHLKHGY